MGYVAKIVYDKDNRVTEENDAHGKIKEMRNRMRKIVAATEENKEEILKLYKIQLGREFCPWDDSYPGMKEIEFDLGREAAAKPAAPTHSKEQLLRSQRYAKRRDLLGALLEDGKWYTLEEVDTAIENFMKGKVK